MSWVGKARRSLAAVPVYFSTATSAARNRAEHGLPAAVTTSQDARAVLASPLHKLEGSLPSLRWRNELLAQEGVCEVHCLLSLVV